jgi:hypothetical protein
VSEAKRILHQPTALADRKGGSSHGKEKSKETGQEKSRREEKETLVSN